MLKFRRPRLWRGEHAPAGRPPRALLAWEFGAGRTHVMHLLGVARHLRALGFQCLASLYDTRFEPEFRALGLPVVQNFVWPMWRRADCSWQERPPTGMSDLLANHGFIDAQSVAAAIAHYDGLFSLYAPDILLCENSFGALLAARGQIPAIAFGMSQLLPPVRGDAFPLFDPQATTPAWPVSEVLAGVNEGLARAGRFPLDTFADLLAIEGAFPFGPSAFDIYAQERREPVLPPFVSGGWPEDEAPPGEEIFVYLHGHVHQYPQVISSLMLIERPMRAYIPDLPAREAGLLRERGIVLEERPVAQEEFLTRARVVLHHGGIQLSTACLAAGRPQIILGKELDNRVTGNFVAERGLGAHAALGDAQSAWIVAEARRGFDDAALQDRCRAIAPEARAWFSDDPARIVAHAAADCLKQRV